MTTLMLHIDRFVDRLQHFNSRGAKEFNCSIVDARALHADITKLMSELHDLQEKVYQQDKVIQIELNGGNF